MLVTIFFLARYHKTMSHFFHPLQNDAILCPTPEGNKYLFLQLSDWGGSSRTRSIDFFMINRPSTPASFRLPMPFKVMSKKLILNVFRINLPKYQLLVRSEQYWHPKEILKKKSLLQNDHSCFRSEHFVPVLRSHKSRGLRRIFELGRALVC